MPCGVIVARSLEKAGSWDRIWKPRVSVSHRIRHGAEGFDSKPVWPCSQLHTLSGSAFKELAGWRAMGQRRHSRIVESGGSGGARTRNLCRDRAAL